MMLATARRAARRSRYSDAELALARERAAASIVAIAEGGGVVWDVRRSRPAAGDYWACCPFHAEKTASFHVSEARGFFKCFGCGEKGDAFTLAARLHGGGFRNALRVATGDAVLEPDPELIAAREQRRREAEAEAKRRAIANRAAAVAIWDAAEPIFGTPATRYLRVARRVAGYLGAADLRWHPAAPLRPYDPAKTAKRPALVARIVNAADEHFGTHVTYLARDGSGKLHRDGSRIVCGEHVGGFIRLGHVRHTAVIGEGIETTLSASDASGLPGLAAINAANLGAVQLPASVRRVLIAFDRDAKGVGELAAHALAERLSADGVAVEMIAPPEGVKDWNDAAQLGALPKVRSAAV